MEQNPIITEIKGLYNITVGQQKKYYSDLLNVAKPVKVVSVKEVFTPEEIRLIQDIIKPQEKQCYKNAGLLVNMFPEKVRYVEGKVMPPYLFPIEHAFNKVGDLYIDITFEIVLKDDVTKIDYVSFGEYNSIEVFEAGIETGVWGGYYNYYWRKKQVKTFEAIKQV